MQPFMDQRYAVAGLVCVVVALTAVDFFPNTEKSNSSKATPALVTKLDIDGPQIRFLYW